MCVGVCVCVSVCVCVCTFRGYWFGTGLWSILVLETLQCVCVIVYVCVQLRSVEVYSHCFSQFQKCHYIPTIQLVPLLQNNSREVFYFKFLFILSHSQRDQKYKHC